MIFERLPRRQTAILLVVCIAVLALVGKRIAAQGTARAPAAQAVALTENRARAVERTPRRGSSSTSSAPSGTRASCASPRALASPMRSSVPGGPSRTADLTLVNLAAPVADGQQIVVPDARRSRRGRRRGAAAGSSAKVSLASATIEQLDALPGIGPVTAQKILDWRQTHGPLRSVDDLDAIPGIGPARVEQLRDLVTP